MQRNAHNKVDKKITALAAFRWTWKSSVSEQLGFAVTSTIATVAADVPARAPSGACSAVEERCIFGSARRSVYTRYLCNSPIQSFTPPPSTLSRTAYTPHLHQAPST